MSATGTFKAENYRYEYSVYGVTLLTNLRLSLPKASGSDVVVAIDVVAPDELPVASEMVVTDPDDWIQLAIREDESLRMRWGSWFEILVPPGGRRVLCSNLSALPLGSLEAYLTNFAVAAALIQQGEEPLHSTVVEINGQAIGLLGPSGAGKSTLAAVLINKGGILVTDDMLRITFSADVAFAQPGPYRIKLLREPADRFLPARVNRGYWNPLGEKLVFEPDAPGNGNVPRRISALYRLDDASESLEPERPSLAALSGAELFKTILSSSINTRLQSPRRLERQFLFCQRLARTLPVFKLSYARSFDTIEDVAGCILDHMALRN